jgi:hypothetical protein
MTADVSGRPHADGQLPADPASSGSEKIIAWNYGC